MLTVHQPRTFSRNLVLYDGDSPVAEVRYRTFNSGAQITIGSTTYDAQRTGWIRSVYTLAEGDRIVAEAEPSTWWDRTFQIRAGSAAYTLQRKGGWFEIGWELLEGDSVVGSLDRSGFFKARTIVDLPPSVDLPVQAFIIWMANVIWQQDQAATAAAAG